MSESPFDKLPKEELDALQEVLSPIAPAHLKGTKPQGILDSWRRLVEKVASEKYEGSVKEYLKELDVRTSIEDALWLPANSPLPMTRAAIESLDQRFRASTFYERKLLRKDSDPDRNWFLLRAPNLQGHQMSSQLYGNGGQTEIVDTDQ